MLAFATAARDRRRARRDDADPMPLTQGLAFVGMAGMIDPLRAEAKDAVTRALSAGIDVRMITGDNPITANAIGASLGLGPGRSAEPSSRPCPTRDRSPACPQLHVLGRVTPEDKLRWPASMQAQEPGRRGDRRRRRRRRRARAGGHRRRDGQRQRGHQAGRADGPHGRQLRNPGARGRARAQGLRQGRRLRPLPDDPAAGPGDAVPRRHGVRHQRRRRPHAVDGAVSAALRDRGRRRGHRRRPRRPERHAAGRRATRSSRSPTGRRSSRGSSTRPRSSSARSCRSSSARTTRRSTRRASR